MLTEDEAREYRERMNEVCETFAQRAAEAAKAGKKEEALMALETALNARRIARGEAL